MMRVRVPSYVLDNAFVSGERKSLLFYKRAHSQNCVCATKGSPDVTEVRDSPSEIFSFPYSF